MSFKSGLKIAFLVALIFALAPSVDARGGRGGGDRGGGDRGGAGGGSDRRGKTDRKKSDQKRRDARETDKKRDSDRTRDGIDQRCRRRALDSLSDHCRKHYAD